MPTRKQTIAGAVVVIVAGAAAIALVTRTSSHTASRAAGKLSHVTTPWSVSTPPVAKPATCTPMHAGQADIDAAPPNTTFCLSGVHNWTLTPKTGDRLFGPAVLDGGHTTVDAIEPGTATGVTLSELEIRNYAPGNQRSAIETDKGAAGWTLRNLQVHDNGTAAGGAGVSVGPGWTVQGGRYYNNRQLGLSGAVSDGAVIDGAEIDHNNFKDDTYTDRNVSCGYEAGGFKWTADNVTVANSFVHDNACVGLWMDANARGAIIRDNHVVDNWDEGILIEISTGATVTRNTVTLNGFKSFRGKCGNLWVFGAGIVLSESDGSSIAHNTVDGNCNGITGAQETRHEAHPGLLRNDSVHDNVISGSGRSGFGTKNGAALSKRNLAFTGNTLSHGMTFCALRC